ncbi:hypothetical protein [Kitasatospora sp. NPDC001527]|uniref:hypothetical protein n=1 Tax=Kitasatospora sp. NPDC001527 TaxID=3154519 RepID=UPI00332396AF
MSAAGREPVGPHDKILRTYTEPEVTSLLGELRERGGSLGVQWDSAVVADPTGDDGLLRVDFGHAPVSTLLNLLDLLREAARR